MEQYYEQSVAGRKSAKCNLIYGLCWLMIVVFGISAMIFAAWIFGDSTRTLTYTDRNVLEVNWWNVLGTALCLLAAGILFVRKDYLRMEYDYILQNKQLEICGVMNRRRRKVLARIDLGLVKMAGSAKDVDSLPVENDLRRHRWYAQACRYYIIYMKDNIRHVALLEMDDHLAKLVRGQLPVGAWRNEKGETTNHASLS